MIATDTNISVLTIDDDPDMRRSIVSYLEDMGFTVYQASGGKEGIAQFERHAPDLVFTDLMMPEVDGLAVVEAINKKSPDTPIVVISGTGSVEYAIQTMRKGAWDYITKPIHDFATIEHVADQVLDRAFARKTDQAYQESLKKAVLSQDRQLAEAGTTDPLTRLPNRSQIREKFGQFLISEQFKGDLFLLLIEVDNVKDTVKIFGHEYGDRMIKDLAERLKIFQRPDTLIGKLDGNEFVVLAANRTDIATMLQQIRQTVLDQPLTIIGTEVYPNYNIGIASFPQDGESTDTLLQHADIARANAKLTGKNSSCYYSQELWQQVQNRIAMESGLRTALARSEFELHYQPKVAAVTRKMVGIEALIRWKPQGSDHLVPPAAFVPVLEDTGMIIEVGRWVLETACSQYMLWRKRGMGAIMLSVNVSAVQFDHGSLHKTVATVLEQTGMPPAQLCLELTERIVVKDIGETVTTLQKLSAIGIKLSIDDFGIGYSSLNYLKNMPINELKIDRSFVMSLPDDAASIAIVDSVLSIARGLSMNVIAEGVETIEQADFLMQRGCHELQGYLFSKPLSQQQLYGWCKDKEYCAGHHEQRLVCTWHEPAPVAQLAGGIAHDFKNLMTGVIGNLSIAKHHLDEHHKSTEAIKRAEKASQRATELAQTLMSIARPGALPPTGCPIQKVIDECLALSLAGSTVHAAVSVAETCSEAAVPEGELCQIVNNLTINALQAMPADGTLNITAETVSIPLENRFGIKSGRYVQIDIRDSGCGMSPKVMAKAFDPYFTTKSGGNGLGLASVKALITKNGGGICMTSEVGAGTSVTIVIPAAEQHSTLHTG